MSAPARDIDDLIALYNGVVGSIETEAESSVDRAYGGIVRAGKGKLVEEIARDLVRLAWGSLGGQPKRLLA